MRTCSNIQIWSPRYLYAQYIIYRLLRTATNQAANHSSLVQREAGNPEPSLVQHGWRLWAWDRLGQGCSMARDNTYNWSISKNDHSRSNRFLELQACVFSASWTFLSTSNSPSWTYSSQSLHNACKWIPFSCRIPSQSSVCHWGSGSYIRDTHLSAGSASGSAGSPALHPHSPASSCLLAG